MPGELYVGGEGLTSGYLNRPELTTQKFIKNPFNTDKKLYKTGDLASYREDGTIDFLGRIDNQVKLRGNRIELDEINTAIQAYPGIEETYVMVLAEEQKTSLEQSDELLKSLEMLDPEVVDHILKSIEEANNSE